MSRLRNSSTLFRCICDDLFVDRIGDQLRQCVWFLFRVPMLKADSREGTMLRQVAVENRERRKMDHVGG